MVVARRQMELVVLHTEALPVVIGLRGHAVLCESHMSITMQL